MEKIIKKIETETEVWIANDGSEFTSESSCRYYERGLQRAELLKNVKYKHISNSASGYENWYRFNSREEFLNFVNFIEKHNIEERIEDWLDNVNFPQWINMEDFDPYITWEEVFSGFENIKKALEE